MFNETVPVPPAPVAFRVKLAVLRECADSALTTADGMSTTKVFDPGLASDPLTADIEYALEAWWRLPVAAMVTLPVRLSAADSWQETLSLSVADVRDLC
jgi:hypothetical protein